MENLDFRSMSRRDLQALCKKHGIPANSTNAVMADCLAALFSKKGPRPVGPSCLKGSGGSGGLQDDAGYSTRSKRKRVTFQLPKGDPDLDEAEDRNDPRGKDSPEPAAAVQAPRVTRSRALRVQGDTETATLRSDVGRMRKECEARTIKHPNVGKNSATTGRKVNHDCMVDEGLMVLRHKLRGLVTHADGAPRRSRRLRDPALTEETGAVAAAAAASPTAVPVLEVPENIEVGSRRGSRKHHQDSMHAFSTSPRGSEPAAENVVRGESETGGPRRSKRNQRNPEFAMAGGGASEISAAENPDLGVVAEKEGSAQICQRRSQRKPARFISEEMGDGVHQDPVGDKLQRQTRKKAPEPADEGISPLASESKNCHGASPNGKKSEVPLGGEHLKRSKRNVRKKSVIDILPTEGINSEDDYGRVGGAVLPTKPNIRTTRRGAAFAKENGKITGSLEVEETKTKVSDCDEPTKRKRRRSVKCGDGEQKVSLPQSEKRGNDKHLVDKKCSWQTKSQRSDKDSPETFPCSNSFFDGNVVMGDVQDSAEPLQHRKITNEAKYQGFEDISKQEEMADGVVQDVSGELGPTESLLATDVPLEKLKTGAEPDWRANQHEEHANPEEDVKKFEFESLKEDSPVNCMGSPAVAEMSQGSCDQEQKEDLPDPPLSNMEDTVENSHANRKAPVRESCDGEVQSSSKESSDKASCSFQCPEEDVGPNEKPDCAQLGEHVIEDSEGKTCTDMMEMQSSMTHGLSSVSEAYNRGCNLTLEITVVGDEGASPLSNPFKETRIQDVTKSPLVDDQGDYPLPDLLTGNRNVEVPVEASETAPSSADTCKTGGNMSPRSDGMQAFRTHGVSYILDDQGSELNGNSLPSPLVRSGDEIVPNEAVAATLPRTLLLEKEYESSSSDGCRHDDHAVEFAEADDPCGSHDFSNACKVAQELTCDVDTKGNIELDVNGNFSGQSFSLFGSSEKTAKLSDKTEGRQRNNEPSAPRRHSICDIASLDVASLSSNYPGIELLDLQNEAGFIADGTSSDPKSLEKNLSTQTEDKCVLKESDDMLTGEDVAIKFSDTTQFSAGKQLKLIEHEVTMEGRAFMHDEVLLVIETSTQMESKEVEVAVDSMRSQETSLNTHPEEVSFDNNGEEAVEATPDTHEGVKSRNKFASKVVEIEDVRGELATDYAVSFSEYKELATPAVRDLDRQTKLQNEKILVTQEAEHGSVQESLGRDLASEEHFSVPRPPHPPAFEEGVELADVQETGRSAEALNVVVAAQLDAELSSSRGVSSELLTVSSDAAVTSLSNHKPLGETYNLANNGCLAGDTVVESPHPFPVNASDKIVEDRTDPADILVNTSSGKQGRPVLYETGKQLPDKIVYIEESFEDNENSPTNVKKSDYMDSYRTTERKCCGVGLSKHRETVELLKDAVGSAEMSGTEVSGWMENTVAEGENAYQCTLEHEKEIETIGDQLGYINSPSAVKTPGVQGAGSDGKCTAGADSGFQIGKLLHGEPVIPSIWPTNSGNMKLSAKSPATSFVETECDVCEIATTGTCLCSNVRGKDRFLEWSQLSDVSCASAEIQVIRPDSRTDYSVLQASERIIEHDSSDEARFEVLCTEKSVRLHDFIDPNGNEKKDEKPDYVSGHNPSYDTFPEVLQTQKSADNHDFTAYIGNEQEHNYPSRDTLEHNPRYETFPEFLQTANAVDDHDFIDNGENEKEVWKPDGDVSENSSGDETCFGDLETENPVGGHGFINLPHSENDDDKRNRDVPEHKSNYVTNSEGIQTETVVCRNFVDHGGNEQEDNRPNRYVSEQDLSSEEESVEEKRDDGNDKLKVVTPGELVSVEHEVKQLKGEKPDQISSSLYQSEVYETRNLMSANDCKDHKELGNEDSGSSLGLPKEEPEHNAQYEHLLQQNKDTTGQEGLVLCFEPKMQADEVAFDENLEHDIKNYTAGTAMIFAELDDIKHEDALSNRHSSTSDDNYFPHVEAPAVEIPMEDIQIALTPRPDIGANLEHVPGSWELKNTVKDMSHQEVAGTVQDQEAVQMWTEEPETPQQEEDLQNANSFDNPYCQDTKDGLTYPKEHEAVESCSVEAHNLGNIVDLEATNNSKSSNRLEDVTRESTDHFASVLCTMNENDQEKSISKSTEACPRGDQGEVGEFYRNTQSFEEMHISDMEIDEHDDEEKFQLASFEELVVDTDTAAGFEELAVDTDTAVGSNGDDGEQPLLSMNSPSANFLGESDSACDRLPKSGKEEDGALVNQFSYAALSDGRKRTSSDLDFAYELVPESAFLSEAEHFALDGTCLDDKHDSGKEITMEVANDTNTVTLQNSEEEDCYRKEDAVTTTGDSSSSLDAVTSLAEEEEINDVSGGTRISSPRNHTVAGRISCTPQRNWSSKIFLQIEKGKENTNTPFSSKMSRSTNTFAEKPTAQTSKRKALANLHKRTQRD